jgi:hypothetical protein
MYMFVLRFRWPMCSLFREALDTSSVCCTQLSMPSYLRRGRASGRNVVFKYKHRTQDNVSVHFGHGSCGSFPFWKY